MKHPTELAVSVTPEMLAFKLANLRYDAMAKYLGHLSDQIMADAEKDRAAGKTQLADRLSQVSRYLGVAAHHMGAAWEICAPYMKEEGSDK